MSKPLRNPKHEKFARLVSEGRDPAEAYVEAGYARDRANHLKRMRSAAVAERIAELKAERELTARAARTPAEHVFAELESHGIDRVADFYEVGAAGLAVRNLGAVKVEVALALLNALHDGFGIPWEQPTR